MLAEYYPLIKHAHMGLALASGSLFAARGLAMVWGATWSMAPSVRRLSYVIDSLLLAAALTLLATLQLNPLGTPWLSFKLTLLVAYILLGTLALKRGKTYWGRVLALNAAFACWFLMWMTARQHQPPAFLSFI